MKHLADIEAEVTRFTNSNPYRALRDRERDPNPRLWIYRADLIEQTSDELPLIVGDFVNNLRSSLDFMVAAFVTGQQRRKSKFPIERKPIFGLDPATGEFLLMDDDSIARRRSFETAMRGLPVEAAAYIRALQP